MPRSGIGVSHSVVHRDELGRFEAAVERSVTKSVREAVKRGADLARGFAPVGTKPDPRTVSLKASIKYEMTSSTQGRFFSDARHALAQEKGARPHLIVGSPYLSFFWEERGRRWIPSAIYYREPGRVDIINHPGNRSQPFMRPAYSIVERELMGIMRKNFPK
jgi:hypothetical protein